MIVKTNTIVAPVIKSGLFFITLCSLYPACIFGRYELLNLIFCNVYRILIMVYILTKKYIPMHQTIIKKQKARRNLHLIIPYLIHHPLEEGKLAK